MYNIFSILYGVFTGCIILFLLLYSICKEYKNNNKFIIFVIPILYIIFSIIVIFLSIKNFIKNQVFFVITLFNKLLCFCNIFFNSLVEDIYIYYIFSIILSIILFCIGIIHDIYYCFIPIQSIQSIQSIVPLEQGYIRKTKLDDIEDECCICIEKYKLLENIHVFNCNHKIHVCCVKELIIYGHIKCPLCRLDII